MHWLLTFRLYLKARSSVISWNRRSEKGGKKGLRACLRLGGGMEQTDRKCGMSLTLLEKRNGRMEREGRSARADWKRGRLRKSERASAREREMEAGGKKVSRLCGDWRSLVPWTGGARLANVQPSPRSTQAVSNHARAATGRTHRLFFFFFFFFTTNNNRRVKN